MIANTATRTIRNTLAIAEEDLCLEESADGDAVGCELATAVDIFPQ